MSRKFAAEFYHDLSSQWKWFDPLGKVHIVSYERHPEQPLLCKGLMEIRNYYSLEGLNWCLLKYQGLSNFDLFIYNEKIEEICYLPPPPPPIITPPPPPLISEIVSPPPPLITDIVSAPLTLISDIVSQHHCPQEEIIQETNWICYPCFFTCKLSTNQATSSQLV